ncbi:MAG TPA: hypothetical protein VJT73_13645 [Polyangiaceae bacterium]|nr:hypothetical protein [Polyangiaceae bacterium]
MFTKDARFDGWTTDDWSRLLGVWKSPSTGSTSLDAGRSRPSGGLLVIHARGRVRKILHTTRGRIEKDGESWPASLPRLAAKHDASWVVAAPAGGLEKIAERFGARSRAEHDLAAQARLLLDIVRELAGAGIIEIWPNRLDRFSLPQMPLFGNTIEALYPVGHLVLIALFHEGELFTSIAVERQTGGISRIAGPDELRRELGILSGDFRRDYRYALAAAQSVLGPIAFGCFSELGIFQGLQRSGSWAAWLRALVVRDVIVTPMKGSLVSPLAADAAVWAKVLVEALSRRSDSLGLILSLWRKWR